MDPAKIATFVRDGGGPILRRLVEDGERVKVEARRLVGVKTGNLRDHIVKRVYEVDGAPAVAVGVDKVPYALMHHEGTVPHEIWARRAPLLVFRAKSGQLVFTRMVHHPGTKPNRFLTDALVVLRR
jgi:hypothetical protein